MKYLVLTLAVFASPALANVGTIVATKGGASVITDGSSRSAVVNDILEEGDVLKTNGTGTIQILLNDDTKFVVGPSTEINIDIATIGQSSEFKKLTIGVAAGTMRFLSGFSNKDAYTIETPASTMGIRGTVFDVVVEGKSDNYVVFDGSVRLCPGRTTSIGSCSILPNSCVVATVNPQRVEAKKNQRREFGKFTLVATQDELLPEFRADVSNCGGVMSVQTSPDAQAPAPAPEAPEAPEAPAPEAPEAPAPEAPEAPEAPADKSGNGNSSNTNGNSGNSQGQGGINSPGNQGKNK